MLPILERRLTALASARVARAIAQRAERELPPGITAEAQAGGVVFSGRRLLSRFVTDPLIRSYLT
jgi:hypothetical protein